MDKLGRLCTQQPVLSGVRTDERKGKLGLCCSEVVKHEVLTVVVRALDALCWCFSDSGTEAATVGAATTAVVSISATVAATMGKSCGGTFVECSCCSVIVPPCASR